MAARQVGTSLLAPASPCNSSWLPLLTFQLAGMAGFAAMVRWNGRSSRSESKGFSVWKGARVPLKELRTCGAAAQLLTHQAVATGAAAAAGDVCRAVSKWVAGGRVPPPPERLSR